MIFIVYTNLKNGWEFENFRSSLRDSLKQAKYFGSLAFYPTMLMISSVDHPYFPHDYLSFQHRY